MTVIIDRAPIGTARGIAATWYLFKLTPAQSRAYKRPKCDAPKYEAISPCGSIIRKATLTSVIVHVERSDAK